MPRGIFERTKRPPEDRFWKKVDKSGDCWEWMAGKNKSGYGQFHYGNLWGAHRFSWLLHNGAIAEGLFVCHVCDNKGCVNPAHLFLGTNQDNLQDASKKGRTARQHGESHGQSKLTEVQVLSIRREYAEGKTQRQLARKYNVSQQHISGIVTRKKWKYLN